MLDFTSVLPDGRRQHTNYTIRLVACAKLCVERLNVVVCLCDSTLVTCVYERLNPVFVGLKTLSQVVVGLQLLVWVELVTETADDEGMLQPLKRKEDRLLRLS